MKAVHVLAFTAAALWFAFLLVGLSGIDGVRSQHVPGYPSNVQLRYYLHIPLGVLAAVAISWIAAARWRLKATATAVAVMALLGLPCYLLFFTGGV
jgi:hypothetical protein